MNEVYENELRALRHEISDLGARPLLIDKHLDALLNRGEATMTEDLLITLSDNAEYDEGMFAIIHVVESLDEGRYGSYESAVLSVFPTLMTSSPRWASIVLMRIMNSDASRNELVRQLRNAATPIKESVRAMCERINKVSPEFLSKTVPVSVASS
ncbi:Imm30 family immunity protein [uncultured Erythrobacter sp.]|uniref:Imm30 family immunity protein n=1 Tax=uncultured Erythrobacter sp. TaxID=263913 RepID=UPI00263989E4|nr:Imm30 family immunity protein [uncultured Erythrobacter sp.]